MGRFWLGFFMHMGCLVAVIGATGYALTWMSR